MAEIIVQPGSSIQAAINQAAPGDIILVEPGTYTEAPAASLITIDKPLTVRSTGGPQVTTLLGTSTSEQYYMVNIAASDVVFDGFTITNPSYSGSADASGIVTSIAGTFSDIQLTNNIIHDIGTPTRTPVSVGTFGFNIGPVTSLEIANNTVYSIQNGDAAAYAMGVFVYGNSPEEPASDVDIHDNVIYDIISPGTVNDGINAGGDATDIRIASNQVRLVKRAIATNAYTAGPVSITGNNVSDASLYGLLLRSPFPQEVTRNTITACGIGIEVTASVTTVPEIHYNNIYNNVTFDLENLSAVTVNAQDNWWGSPAGPTKVAGPVADVPFQMQPVGHVNPQVRLFSSGGSTGLTYVSGLSREDAIAGALGIPSTTVSKAIVLTNTDTDIAMRTWDRIAPYTNSAEFDDLTIPPGLTTPQFVWDVVTLDGETRFFAAAAEITPDFDLSGLFIRTTTFADNGHDYQASIYSTNKTLMTQGQVLFDGDTTTPSLGLTEQPPFNWQTLRSNTEVLSAALTSGTLYYLVVSYRVTNYLQKAGLPNPAGLSFIVDVWNSV